MKSTILVVVCLCSALTVSLPSLAQVGTLKEVIMAGRDGKVPGYIGDLMCEFGEKLKQFVIEKRVNDSEEILQLFGTITDMMIRVCIYPMNAAYYVAMAGMPNVQDTDRNPLWDACEHLEMAWRDILNDHRHGMDECHFCEEDLSTFHSEVYATSFFLSRQVSQVGYTHAQARRVRYRFAEWKVLNYMLEHAIERLENFYSYPRIQMYERSLRTQTVNNPRFVTKLPAFWEDVYFTFGDATRRQSSSVRGAHNPVIANPMETPADWIAFRTKHFESLSREAWVFLAPWIAVVDALVFGPTIVQFNIGRLSRSSPISLLPGEILRMISMLIAPPLYKK